MTVCGGVNWQQFCGQPLAAIGAAILQPAISLVELIPLAAAMGQSGAQAFAVAVALKEQTFPASAGYAESRTTTSTATNWRTRFIS